MVDLGSPRHIDNHLSSHLHFYHGTLHLSAAPLCWGHVFSFLQHLQDRKQAGTFLVCTVYNYGHLWIYFMENFWSLVLWVCEPLKLFLILYRIIKGPYRGVFHSKINTKFKVSHEKISD